MLKENYNEMINGSKVFLFMKGDKTRPQCRFSAQAISVLNQCEADFNSFDILSDMDVRASVKEFSGWPTYPQLYVDGKLLGGSDIIVELHETGELEAMLKK